MSEFDGIRPYNDEEVGPVLQRLLNDKEFLDSIVKFKVSKPLSHFSFALRGLVRARLKKEVEGVNSVTAFQAQIEKYLVRALDQTVSELSVSGLDQLDSQSAYLFVSNHRDIVMDPALVNLVLYRAGFSTLRIAIGDNLLTKPFASDLMRLNKSFIVNRSATAPREKLKAAKLLSKYIHHSVMNDSENVWIAQREGRAKDGLDRTNSAIISMLAYSKPKAQSLSDYIKEARVVPVSLSYEYDPCDADKAMELYSKETLGSYEKAEHEDVQSIARGITGFKGHVNLAFGEPLSKEFENTDSVTAEIDEQILSLYQLHPSNCFAYEALEGKSPDVLVGKDQQRFLDMDVDSERKVFKERLANIDKPYHSHFLASYANPVKDKLSLSLTEQTN